MSSDPKELNAEDLALWASVAADIEPIVARKPRIDPPRPEPRAAMQAADDAQVMSDALNDSIDPALFDNGDQLSFRREGIRTGTLRKLRRGQYRVEAEIDLHGHTRVQARHALHEFLNSAARRHHRCVRVIHGKGLRSPRGEPVLKARVEISLKQRDDVLAYASAPPWLGGFGAVLVLLRKV